MAQGLGRVLGDEILQPHDVGIRMGHDIFVVDNDGALFAAPTVPGKVLNGHMLKGKEMPEYVKVMQRPDLKNPLYVSHLTLDLGNRLERPDKLLLTRYGFGFNTWDMPVMASMGDSAIGLYWEPKEIRPGGKREYDCATQGISPNIAVHRRSSGFITSGHDAG